ncbi:MAG TPA: hypothetical protein RMG45_08585 [Polyangiaceae bacterium LLY-WYZ-15_(1-7)]|nr:hypothetical protein [Polyangiaceae bacterium LLY-WYZ-15_(1-7)]
MSLFAKGGPWLFGRRTDLLAFGGSAALAFALLGLGAQLGILEADAPDWIWLSCILVVDVAHVWSTIYRVYLDGAELRRRPLLYVGAPLACYAAGVLLHAMSGALFWTVLAYVAVFHFVRQQVGWVALYARREGAGPLDRRVDLAATYAATVWPLVWWHGHLPRSFHWFLEGDFVVGLSAELAAWTFPLYAALLGGWALRQLIRLAGRGPKPSPGKLLVVATTWACWYVGIVALDGDFAFTVTNVLIHGVPYLVLTYRYGRHRAARRPASTLARVLRGGALVFVLSVIALAFVEELAWDRWVWHDRPWLFGEGGELGAFALSLLVPLLALPQATHYVLDGFIWRMGQNPVLR